MRTILLIFCLTYFSTIVGAQSTFTVKGKVADNLSKEGLPMATIVIKGTTNGTVADIDGSYELKLKKGEHILQIDFVEYLTIDTTINVTGDMTLDIALKMNTMDVVEVNGIQEDNNLSSTEMGTVELDMETMKKIPSLFGEVDVIRAIQLLPGVQASGEGSTGMYIRGGNADHNIVLIDQQPLYSPAHLMGFFSVFNSDAVSSVKLYKGGTPSYYGGRLAGVLDVKTVNGDSAKISGSGGIGTISSRLALKGTIAKGKIDYLIAGRRTYADIFLPLSRNEDLHDSKLYFYDLNGKINYRINDKNTVSFSSYSGKDVFKTESFGINWGNRSASLIWKHTLRDNLFLDVSAIHTRYKYQLASGDRNSGFEWNSSINSGAGKVDLEWEYLDNSTFKTGISLSHHQVSPAEIVPKGSSSVFNTFKLPVSQGLEGGIYVSNQHNVGEKLTLEYGVRLSTFHNVGEYTSYNFEPIEDDLNDNYYISDSTIYEKGKTFNFQNGLEPRFSASYRINKVSTIKGGYNRMRQYLQLASNSTSVSPFDMWFLSSPNVAPQIADQVALGYFRNFKENTYETSVEVYYKDMQNQVDFKDHAQLFLNREFEGELRYGKGYSYGAEFLVRKNKGKLTGWVGYTYSKTQRKIAEINNGEWYSPRYDKTHDISIVSNYELNERITIGGVWVYSTGAAITVPSGSYSYGKVTVPVYTDRNAARMPAYHRMDLALTINPKEKPNRKWYGSTNISIYNVYAQKNPYSIDFTEDPDTGEKKALKTYLFSIIPSITYNFNF